MLEFSRRQFFSASLGGVAATYATQFDLFAEDSSTSNVALKENLKDAWPDTLVLTWQRDPTTTMTIQWIAPDSPSPIPIAYSPLGSNIQLASQASKTPYTNTDLKVYRCELSNLSQGSEYQFQIGSMSPVYRFRTMPAKATNTIQFVSGGDCGIDQHAIGTNIIAAKQEPYFALIGGDLAYDDGKSPETFTKFLQNYRRHMIDAQGRLIPMLACIGNHEVIGGYRGKRSD
ncbi:MAG: metallophosphoesterase, partial [Planctomycetes bacterium]|nr:metallophosphoesterase [Planctomycetota bacterium]